MEKEQLRRVPLNSHGRKDLRHLGSQPGPLWWHELLTDQGDPWKLTVAGVSAFFRDHDRATLDRAVGMAGSTARVAGFRFYRGNRAFDRAKISLLCVATSLAPRRAGLVPDNA